MMFEWDDAVAAARAQEAMLAYKARVDGATSVPDALARAQEGMAAIHQAIEGKPLAYRQAFLRHVIEHCEMQVTFYRLMLEMESERGNAE